VINLSIHENAVDPQLEAAIQDAISAGLTVVNSVPDSRQTTISGFGGNWGLDPCNGSTAVSPSRMPGIIAVGGDSYATSATLGIGGTLTNYDIVANPDVTSHQYDVGNCIALFAAATGIDGATNTGDNDTNYMSGTSFSAPIVAGVAAIYLQTHAHASPAAVKSAITNASLTGQIIECIQSPGGGVAPTIHYLGDSFCPRTASNRLAHLPLPVGSDIAVGGTTSGAWADLRKIVGALMSAFDAIILTN